MNTLVVIGDSHPYRMARTASFVFPLPATCMGVPSETAEQVYSRLPADCLAYDPKCVIVFCGTNSVIKHGITDAHAAWACGDDARLAGARVVLVKIPPCGDWSDPSYYYHTSYEGNVTGIQVWNASIASYANTLNAATPGCCEVADLFTPFLNADGSFNDTLFLTDKLHFNEAGNEVAAKILRQAVLDLFD